MSLNPAPMRRATMPSPRHAPPVALAASLALHAATAAVFAFRGAPPPETEEAAPNAAHLTGDAFDVPEVDEPDPVDVDEAAGESAPATGAAEPAGARAPSAASPSRAPSRDPAGSHRRAASPGAPAGGGAQAAPAALYGAVGERGAVDLATAFTRAFPQAASTDPAWTTAPFGRAGAADVVLTLDPAGKLVQTAIGGGASPALRRGIDRTVALIRGRSFTARDRVTTLRLAAAVAPDQVHDGLHGDVFAIGGSFSGTGGGAFFALAIGRRVDLTVRLTALGR